MGGRDYRTGVPPAGRILVALAMLLALTVASAGGAPSITEQIFADYSLDKRIDQPWSAEQLEAALDAAESNGASFAEFQRAVQVVYDDRLLGLEGGVPSVPSAGDDSGLLPQPAPPGERERPPWPFIGLSLLAGGLLLGGAGSTIYRRLAR